MSGLAVFSLKIPSLLQFDTQVRGGEDPVKAQNLRSLFGVEKAFSLFFACYQAEVFRGGFQAIPSGQFEAGMALGLGKWQSLGLIILPQVFRHALPATINMVVVTFKETAVVIIIGLFDLLASAQAAFGTGDWVAYYMETYIFVALIYWAFITSLGRYGECVKERMKQDEH